MTLTITGWRCLDCDLEWTGSSLASVKPIELNDLGRELREHVLTLGHVTAPITVEAGQGELF